MNSLKEIYEQNVEETNKNLNFWEGYLKDLESLDFNEFSDKLTVPILVPIGSRIMFRGELKHTNEVTVALGANYFAKCSIKQAEVLKQHRIKDAKTKVKMYTEEREYLEKQVLFKNNIFETQGREIIETYTEEEDKVGREKHKENVRKYKKEMRNDDKTEEHKTYDELWSRLDELELQEELENEMQELNNTQNLNTNKPSETFITKEIETINGQNNLTIVHDSVKSNKKVEDQEILTNKAEMQTSKMNLQEVLDRQKELENKLDELKYRETKQSKNENDLITKLDDMQELDDLEDEVNRLEGLLETEDNEEEKDVPSQSTIAERRVSFADNDDSPTLEITFKHSTIEADCAPYHADNGMQKPSNIYELHSNLFGGSTSILKKSKYDNDKTTELNETKINLNKLDMEQMHPKESIKTIIIKDVKERGNEDDQNVEKEDRPKSLFKKMRMKNKS